MANSPDVVIYKYGRYLYDNLILFCPGTEDFTTLDAAGISNFVEKVGDSVHHQSGHLKCCWQTGVCATHSGRY